MQLRINTQRALLFGWPFLYNLVHAVALSGLTLLHVCSEAGERGTVGENAQPLRHPRFSGLRL